MKKQLNIKNNSISIENLVDNIVIPKNIIIGRIEKGLSDTQVINPYSEGLFVSNHGSKEWKLELENFATLSDLYQYISYIYTNHQDNLQNPTIFKNFYHGRLMTYSEINKLTGVSIEELKERKKAGYSENSLVPPEVYQQDKNKNLKSNAKRRKKKYVEFLNSTRYVIDPNDKIVKYMNRNVTLRQLSIYLGIDYNVLLERYNKGYRNKKLYLNYQKANSNTLTYKEADISNVKVEYKGEYITLRTLAYINRIPLPIMLDRYMNNNRGVRLARKMSANEYQRYLKAEKLELKSR